MTTKKATSKGRRTAADRATEAEISRQAAEEELTEEELIALSEEADLDDEDIGPVSADGTITPVEIGKRGRVGVEQVHIFTLDGTRYYVPKKPNRAILLKFWTEATDKRKGVNVATQNALIALLGKEALDSLAESPLTTDDDVADVFVIASTIFFGAIEEMRKTGARPADPSKRGPKKRRG